MDLSIEGLEFIKKHEGLRLKPYLCSAGKPTIGYGCTSYENGRKVQLNDPEITIEQAENLLKIKVAYFSKEVAKSIKKGIVLTQNQFDALVSFAFNLGVSRLRKSTLLKRVNENPNDPRISKEFNKWIKANNKIENGLVKRRKQESELYFK